MKIIVQRTRRRKTENGFVFAEKPQVIVVKHQFENKGCKDKLHIATVPFGRHYSECQKKLNDCIPNTALTYTEGEYTERPVNCEKC